MRTAQLKLTAAGIGAVVAMGALGVVMGGAPEGVPADTVAFNQTEEEAPEAPDTTPATTFAEPPVEVEVPDGYDQVPD